jgi:Arc/MetJ-type ribon-helix-helix transcriptional regulator
MTKRYQKRNLLKHWDDEIGKLVADGRYVSKDAFVNEAVRLRLEQVKPLKERNRVLDGEAAVLREQLRCLGGVDQ